jgi:hypothetical protein
MDYHDDLYRAAARSLYPGLTFKPVAEVLPHFDGAWVRAVDQHGSGRWVWARILHDGTASPTPSGLRVFASR